VIPEIISQADKSTTIHLGNNSIRDFQYAGDAVRMAVSLLEHGEFGQVYNMGSEHIIKIYELAELIGRLMQKSLTVSVDPTRFRPWEIWHLQSNNQKLYGVIPLRPKVGLEEALDRTIRDYRDHGFIWSN
jgi:nucleoside-diphosphate-sugar epimerase